MPNAHAFRRAAPLAFIALFFLFFARPGVWAYFTGDDLMNLEAMHGLFTVPLGRVALSVFLPFSSLYRPLGGLFYRAIFAVAGFHPLAFRLACFALLLGNLFLAWRLLRMLSGSREAALLGALIFCYHGQFHALYFNTGTVYDILCFTFYTLALTLYFRYRRGDGGLPPAAWAALLLCDLMALQSKEMAWSLPIILLDAVLLPGERKQSIRAGLKSFAPAAAALLLTLAPLLPRILGPTGLTASPLYRPTLTAAYYLENCARFWGLILYLPGVTGVAVMLASWLAMAGVAVWLRSRAMGFGLVFWIVTLIPVAFIAPRGGYVLYLPFLGLSLYAGVLLVRLREAIAARWGDDFLVPSQVLLFLAVASVLGAGHARQRMQPSETIAVQRLTRDLVVQARALHPTLARGAHVLFVEEPFADEWFLAFLFRLLYDDPGLWVDIASTHPHARPYQYVLSYAGGKLTELPPRLAPCEPHPVTAGVADDASPLLCWTGDWISQRFPQAWEETLTYAGDPGAAVTIAFRGTALEYVCTKALNRGTAELSIDGEPRGVLDLYSRDPVWQAVYRFDNLAPGEHRAVLRVLGRHNSAALDSIVDVDAFRVR